MATIIEIPGGKATLRDDRAELTQRRLQPITLISARLGKGVAEALPTAGRIMCEGDVLDDRTDQLDKDGERIFPGPDVNLSERQLEHLTKMGVAVGWALLKDWTLDQPLPETPDGMYDLPPDLFGAIVGEAAKINAQMGGGGFTVDEGMETLDDDGKPDQSLPTGV